MKNRAFSTVLTLWANRLIALVLLALVPSMPFLLDWYSHHRDMTPSGYTAVLAAFYCCAVVTAVALWNLDALLRSVLSGEVFTRDNVRRIHRLRWCCGCVALICIPAACIYYPLVFMVIIMGFLSLVVSVLCQVMDAAVSIREENDLTI